MTETPPPPHGSRPPHLVKSVRSGEPVKVIFPALQVCKELSRVNDCVSEPCAIQPCVNVPSVVSDTVVLNLR